MSPLNSHTLSSVLPKLEFDKVVHHISRLAASTPGSERCLGLEPQTDRQGIVLELNRVSEAKELLIAEGSIPLEGVKDIRPALKRTAVENQVLGADELLAVASTLHASRSLHGFLARRQQLLPHLAEFLPRLMVDKVVEYNITEALDEDGTVKDSASRELREIRRGIAGARDALRKRLESILKRVSAEEVLQEQIITTRDGRMVIPVKAEYKNQVAGFIHSSSASGATVFVEPAESLEFNNALRELELREQREVHRILKELTHQVAAIREPLGTTLEALVELDCIFARAKYSIEVIGVAPAIAEEPVIRFRGARHPVLLQRHARSEVVPLDLGLGGDTTTLVITGPNAGGKTVAMKTVGLLALCAQAGIHLPADSDSEVFPFTSFFADIGDDQSIENDLSTFSSHVLKIREILDQAGPHSIVLVDEIGAGTDPAEGGALAASVLESLTQRKSFTIATTHHGTLKVFAHETPGIINGSMEFDQASLRPTYRFREGIPGSSFAFELAERIGVPASVLSSARTRVGKDKIQLESLLIDLERQSQELKRQGKEAAREQESLRALVKSYEFRTAELKRDLGTIRKKALDEARALVKQAQSEIEASVRSIRESGGNNEIIRAARHAVRALTSRITADEDVDDDTRPAETLAKGDKVRLSDGREVGEVVTLQGEFATVLWDHGKLKVSVRKLVRATDPGRQQAVNPSTEITREAATEVDIRGMFGDEAIPVVERFLDNAVVNGLHRVDIIHGKGTGALRKRILAWLKSAPHVASFRTGEWNEGGMGVTVVELK